MKEIFGLLTKELEKRMSNKEEIENREKIDITNVSIGLEKKLIKYIRNNLSYGYSLESIKKTLIKYGYGSFFIGYLIGKHENKVKNYRYAFGVSWWSRFERRNSRGPRCGLRLHSHRQTIYPRFKFSIETCKQ